MRKFICLFLLSLTVQLNAQNISGVINDYARVIAFDTCPLKLTLVDASAFSAGDVVLIIQMQGASMVQIDGPSYGNITNINQAGNYERAVIDSINGNSIWFEKLLINTYNPFGNVQLVRVPQYIAAFVTDTLTCPEWNGETGGVLALEVSGSLNMGAPISTTGKGFEGGGFVNSDPNFCSWLFPVSGYVYSNGDWESSLKGEGIVITPIGSEAGRGHQANGGGAGNDHNSGGAGGANRGAGGKGGNNDEPGAFNCNGYNPGEAGASLVYSNRAFLGGGGGSGHGNNNNGTPGAPGGGIIYISAGQINSGGFPIEANGENAVSSQGDGAGGGGAGGTVLLDVPSFTANISIEATGGSGGDVNNLLLPRCMGPGGGGGGGLISSSVTLPGTVTASVSGGASGLTISSSATTGCDGTAVGAGAGSNGAILNSFTIPEGVEAPELYFTSQPSDISLCVNEIDTFQITAGGQNLTYQWQVNSGSGFANLLDTGFFIGSSSSELMVASAQIYYDGLSFRCIISSPCLDSITSDSVNLSVAPPPSFTSQPSSTVSCENGIAGFGVFLSGGNNIMQWQIDSGSGWTDLMGGGAFAGTNSPSLILQPVDTTMENWRYRCAVSSCGITQFSDSVTLGVNRFPQANFNYSDSAGVVQFENQSIYSNSFVWNFGDGATDSLANTSHFYSSNGNYAATLYATNDCGTDSLTQFIQISGVGIAEHNPTKIRVYPNPSTGLITMEWKENVAYEIRLIDLSGKPIIRQKGTGAKAQIQLKGKWFGTGFILISTPNWSHTERITVLPE